MAVIYRIRENERIMSRSKAINLQATYNGRQQWYFAYAWPTFNGNNGHQYEPINILMKGGGGYYALAEMLQHQCRATNCYQA